jgi:hypothetical protein
MDFISTSLRTSHMQLRTSVHDLPVVEHTLGEGLTSCL